MIALLAGPFAKIAAIGAVVMAVLVAAFFWFRANDAAIRAQDAAAVTSATAAAQARDSAAAIQALEASAAADRTAAAVTSSRKEAINHAPDADKIVDDPAVLNALRLLGADAGTGDGKAANPAITP